MKMIELIRREKEKKEDLEKEKEKTREARIEGKELQC